MSQASGGKFDAWGKPEFGVSREIGIGGAVVEEVLSRDRAVEGGEEILRCDAVTCGLCVVSEMWDVRR